MSRVVIAGAGTLGQALAARLAPSHDVRCVRSSPELPSPAGRVSWHRADLTTTPDAELALTGAQTVVHLAHVTSVPARLPRAAAEDLDLLLADSVARAAKRVGARHLVHFASGDDDARVPLLERAGVPLTVVRHPGDDAAETLARVVAHGPGATLPTGGRWARRDEGARAPWLPTCSIQRYRRPEGWSALDLTRAYFRWLPSDVPLLKTTERDGVHTLALGGVAVLMLRLVPARCSDDCAWLAVSGGLLNGAPEQEARMEFRVLLDGATAMATLVGYQPSLPFGVYRFTQAFMHERVMRRFGAWLAEQRGPPPAP